jgi:hypothetical protein
MLTIMVVAATPEDERDFFHAKKVVDLANAALGLHSYSNCIVVVYTQKLYKSYHRDIDELECTNEQSRVA